MKWIYLAYVYLFLTSSFASDFSPCDPDQFNYVSSQTETWSVNTDKLIEELLDQTQIPGAEILIGRSQGQIIKHKAYGLKAVSKSESNNNQLGNIYDLASISKIFTAISIMQLIEQKKFKLSTPISRIIKNFKHKKTTIEDLLRHKSGLPPGVPNINEYKTQKEIWDYIYSADLNPKYVGKFRYGDLNYIILANIVELYTRKYLSTNIKNKILNPLKMQNTFHNPKKSIPKLCSKNCMPTRDYFSQKVLKGVVHDPTSQKLGGRAGSAGVFSTTKDLAKLVRVFIGDYDQCKKLPLKISSIKNMLKYDPVSKRGLGFDINSPYSVWMVGDFFTLEKSFGHSGFTGTAMWIDPVKDFYIILFTNSVYSKNYRKDKRKLRDTFTSIVNSLSDLPAL